MAKYKIEITKTAVKQLDKLLDADANKVIEAIKELADEPRPKGCKKLRGRNGYRIRQGNYRIIYEIFDKILLIEVIAIGHRRDIYE